MFVTNIRYGELPVRKVYLGEKLIWQCDDVCGYAESSLYTKAYFYMSAVAALIGNSQSTFQEGKTIASVLELSIMMSEIESKSCTNSIANLIANLPMYGDGYSESNSDTIGSVINAILTGGYSNSELDNNGMDRLGNAHDLQSNITIRYNMNVAGGVSSIPMPVNGNVIVNFNDDVFGCTPNSIDIATNTVSHLSTKSIAGCIIPFKVKAFAESDSYGSAMPRIFDVMSIGGDAYTNNTGEAILKLFDLITMIGDEKHYSSAEVMCKLFELLQMKGDAKSKSDAKSYVFLREPVQSIGRSKDKTFGDNFISKYLLVAGESEAEHNSYGSAPVNLWCPPIGDDVVLSESDGIDISVNGDVLEIRQAYQINIDKESGILEVI